MRYDWKMFGWPVGSIDRIRLKPYWDRTIVALTEKSFSLWSLFQSALFSKTLIYWLHKACANSLNCTIIGVFSKIYFVSGLWCVIVVRTSRTKWKKKTDGDWCSSIADSTVEVEAQDKAPSVANEDRVTHCLNCQKSDRSVQFHTDEFCSAMDKQKMRPPFSALSATVIHICRSWLNGLAEKSWSRFSPVVSPKSRSAPWVSETRFYCR